MYKSFTILAVTAAYAAANNTCTWDWPATVVPTPVTPNTTPVTPVVVPYDITEHLC